MADMAARVLGPPQIQHYQTSPHNQIQPPSPSHQGGRSPKHTRAAVRIGTLNIRGYRSAGGTRSENKWYHVNQLVRDKNLGILMVQETHLTDERKDDIEKLFGRRLKIHHSSDPENPTGKGGVAVVLNKNLVNVQNSVMKVIIPGRAILISVNWHRSEVMNILTVYAPNVTESNGDENGQFWLDLKNFFTANPNVKVDVMAGDYNMVEDAQDRSPARDDPERATDALDQLKSTLYLRDAWRNAFPTDRAFTFIQDSTA